MSRDGMNCSTYPVTNLMTVMGSRGGMLEEGMMHESQSDVEGLYGKVVHVLVGNGAPTLLTLTLLLLSKPLSTMHSIFILSCFSASVAQAALMITSTSWWGT